MSDLKTFALKSINMGGDIQLVKRCNTLLDVDGERWLAHEVSIVSQELLFFCDKGTAVYMVDNYGGRPVVELFDWEKEGER